MSILMFLLNTNLVCYPSYRKMFAQPENKLISSALAVFSTILTLELSC